ncbi:glycosyltransferase family 2 protein [Patescibacteria group bacterium]|nr:glycosyltransferase family 2 protein [Patescibacteria group bacterium]
MKENPLISVIMPVFNTEKYLREAIDSVFGQTYKNIELIAIDDGSIDSSAQILESYGDKIIFLKNTKNTGIANCRNQGILSSHGDLIALMDSDDIWKLDKLELQVAELKENKNIDISFCFFECFISPELPEEVKQTRYCPEGVMSGHVSAAALIKREIFDKVGYFDTKWTVGEFIDWCSRAKDLGFQTGMVEKVLYLRRIHASNTGVTERPSRTDYLKIVQNAIHRKRAKE